MKGSSFEQFLVLTKKGVYVFAIYGHDSQWSMTISTSGLSRFNSRIDTKFGGFLKFPSEIATADMQMLYMQHFSNPAIATNERLIFEQFLVCLLFFAIYGHDSQWSMTIWTSCLSRFNSRVDMKFGEFLKLKNIMILYMYTAQEQGKITLTE